MVPKEGQYSMTFILQTSTFDRAAYLGSMGGTLYAALAMHSYVMSLICCAAQVLAADEISLNECEI